MYCIFYISCVLKPDYKSINKGICHVFTKYIPQAYLDYMNPFKVI